MEIDFIATGIPQEAIILTDLHDFAGGRLRSFGMVGLARDIVLKLTAGFMKRLADGQCCVLVGGVHLSVL